MENEFFKVWIRKNKDTVDWIFKLGVKSWLFCGLYGLMFAIVVRAKMFPLKKHINKLKNTR